MKILNEIQQKLTAPKGQRNDFGKYNYRSCEDIMMAVKPLLGKAILTVSDEMVMLGERFYVKATATLTDGEKSISVSAYAREPLDRKGMDASQITGATSSYARKYALNGLFAIDDAKDADSTNTHGKSEKKDDTPKESMFQPYIDGTGWSEEKVQAILKLIEVNDSKLDRPSTLKAAVDSIGVDGIIKALKAHDQVGRRNNEQLKHNR